MKKLSNKVAGATKRVIAEIAGDGQLDREGKDQATSTGEPIEDDAACRKNKRPTAAKRPRPQDPR